MAKQRKGKARASSSKKGKKKRERLKPISLHPLEFDEVMRRLVRTSSSSK
jgi:hypothetical protein